MTVLTRPMFRRNGSPSVGERSAALQSLIEDINDVKNLSPNIVGPPTRMDNERLGIRTQIGKSLRDELMKPFDEFAGTYVRNTKTGKFEPMSGGTEGMSIDPNSTVREGEFDTVIVIDRREGSDTFGMPIGVPRNMDTYEMIRSGDFEETTREILDRNSVTREGEFNPESSVIREGEFNPLLNLLKDLIERGEPIPDKVLRGGEFDPLVSRLTSVLSQGEKLPPRVLEAMGRAEGSPMEGEKSDAVGIADGLDKEMAKSDPNTTGVAKVSPQQYVELMNQVRGDEVPMEGRVQELAGVVGEKDAQDTPLSVLALVQPVFELQEQQGGLAAAPGAQQMMQQAPMMMKEGGIVHRDKGSDQEGENAFSTLTTAGFDPALLKAVEQFGKEYFGVGTDFDTEAARQQYEQMLMNKSQMRDQAFLDAAPRLLKLGSVALNPEATLSDVFQVGASELAGFGTNVGKQTKAIEDQALKLALADKAKQEQKESAYMSAIAPKLIETAFQNPQDVALKALEITEKTLANAKSKAELGVLDEQLLTQLQTDKANLEKILIENETLPESTKLSLQRQLVELNGLEYDNQNKLLQNEFQTIQNQFIEGEKNAALEGQLLNNINQQLENFKLGVENEYIRTEKDLKLEELNANIDSILGKNAGQAITNEKGLIELENFDTMQTLELIEKQEEINKLIAEQKELDFEKINAEGSFRKEFKQLQVYKNTDLRYTAFNNLLAAANEDSAAGDVAFIFEFMRMVDPNSVVREGEFQLAEDASPLMLKLDKLLNKAKTGERLLSSQRDEFLSTAGSILDKSIKIYQDTEKEYQRIAGNIFKESDVSNIVVGIQFDQNILNSLENDNAFDEYLKGIGID